MGKETTDWVKFKNLKDDDFVVCGYADSGDYSVSIILGQYSGKELVYKGHVLLGKSSSEFKIISRISQADTPPFSGEAEASATYVQPELVCIVKYMELTGNGMLRQPVFKGLRDDKTPWECIVH
jgi:ATP-dependent DNA ligase